MLRDGAPADFARIGSGARQWQGENMREIYLISDLGNRICAVLSVHAMPSLSFALAHFAFKSIKQGRIRACHGLMPVSSGPESLIPHRAFSLTSIF
jgi:hypothetical protein